MHTRAGIDAIGLSPTQPHTSRYRLCPLVAFFNSLLYVLPGHCWTYVLRSDTSIAHYSYFIFS